MSTEEQKTIAENQMIEYARRMRRRAERAEDELREIARQLHEQAGRTSGMTILWTVQIDHRQRERILEALEVRTMSDREAMPSF
jgi:hypothetical protein